MRYANNRTPCTGDVIGVTLAASVHAWPLAAKQAPVTVVDYLERDGEITSVAAIANDGSGTGWRSPADFALMRREWEKPKP